MSAGSGSQPAPIPGGILNAIVAGDDATDSRNRALFSCQVRGEPVECPVGGTDQVGALASTQIYLGDGEVFGGQPDTPAGSALS
jgi:hypothetical protein